MNRRIDGKIRLCEMGDDTPFRNPGRKFYLVLLLFLLLYFSRDVVQNDVL